MNSKSISDSNYSIEQLASVCKESNEPLILTKDGKPHSVLMSVELYNEHMATLELFTLLEEADAEKVEELEQFNTVSKRLREKFDSNI
ncbi:MAG: hypothetical protein ACRC5C_12455 [Bacilli bacterium]